MLTTVQIRSLKPAQRPYKVADSDGLFLLVQPTGALLWRFRYKVFGQERKLPLGTFPDLSLQQARRKRDEARAQLIDGIDPGEEKRQRCLEAKLAAKTTFQLVAEEYLQKMQREGKSPATLKKVRWFLELMAGIAKRPIASITPHELLDVLKRASIWAVLATFVAAPSAEACRVFRSPEQRIADAYARNAKLRVALVRITEARRLTFPMSQELRRRIPDYEDPWRATAVVARVLAGE